MEEPIIMRFILSLRNIPNIAFGTVGLIAERFLCEYISPSGDRLCDVLGFVSAGSVSSSSALQIFRDTSCVSHQSIRSVVSLHSGMMITITTITIYSINPSGKLKLS